MSQSTVQLADPALTQLQKAAQILQQRLEGCEHGIMLLELINEALARTKALRSTKVRAQVCTAPRETIERGELLRAKTTRETRSWQPQRLPHRAYPDARKPIEY